MAAATLKTSLDYAAIYGDLHKNEKHYSGQQTKYYADIIGALVTRVQFANMRPLRLLDFGCGKGMQYLAERVHMRWGGILPYCYDVGVRQLRARPTGKFDGIICVDVLEHIAEEDVDVILRDIFSFAVDASSWRTPAGFVLLGISTKPAKNKRLPTGENVHLTVKPAAWWQEKIACHKRDDLIVQAVFDIQEPA